MPTKTNRNRVQRIIPRPGDSVKARIVGAGLSMGDIAAAAKISRPDLSKQLAGDRANRDTQLRIWDAYRRLTGSRVTLEGFWGELLREEDLPDRQAERMAS